MTKHPLISVTTSLPLNNVNDRKILLSFEVTLNRSTVSIKTWDRGNPVWIVYTVLLYQESPLKTLTLGVVR